VEKVTMREDDALNRAACQWARQHPERFPVDRRPLKRRAVTLHMSDVSERASHMAKQLSGLVDGRCAAFELLMPAHVTSDGSS
jgi:hypothetical protein